MKTQYVLSVFIAQNGTGKTTLLNAITWCLYEEEFQTKATDASLFMRKKESAAEPDGEEKTFLISVRLFFAAVLPFVFPGYLCCSQAQAIRFKP